jgi:alkylated DNA repair dioxygenase AlkB
VEVPLKVSDLLPLRPAEQGKVRIMGAEVTTPRFSAHYLRSYKYTGMIHPAEPLPQTLQPLLDWANGRAEEWGAPAGRTFNQALVNFYMDGTQCIGRHSDDESQLAPGGIIFSASFGQTRIFRIHRKNQRGDRVMDLDCTDRSFIVMAGAMQKEFAHEVPRVSGLRGAKMGPRVNVTFRMFK